MNHNNSNDNPLSASGRFGRLSYLGWTMLSSIIILMLLGITAMIFGTSLQPENISLVAFIPFIIIYIGAFYVTFVFAIRRLHDRNHSGWLSLLVLVPVANLILILYLIFAKGDAGPNNYGAPRSTTTWEKILAWLYIAIFPLGLLAAIFIPSYQNYVERAQMQQYQQIQQHQQDQ